MKSPLITIPAALFLLFTLLGCIHLSPTPTSVEAEQLDFASTIDGQSVEGPFELRSFDWFEGTSTFVVSNGSRQFRVDIEGTVPSWEEGTSATASVSSMRGEFITLTGVGTVEFEEHDDGLQVIFDLPLHRGEVEGQVDTAFNPSPSATLEDERAEAAPRVGLIMGTVVVDC